MASYSVCVRMCVLTEMALTKMNELMECNFLIDLIIKKCMVIERFFDLFVNIANEESRIVGSFMNP